MQHLQIAETVRQQKARYCRFIDTRQWEALAGLLKADIEVVIYDADDIVLATFSSAPAFITATQEFLADARSSHQVHNSELSVEADGRVAVIWSMQDRIVRTPRDGTPATTMRGYGHYHEIWEHVGGAWLIARLELRRTILDITKEARS